ncbi:MAG: M1 family metallopeptidase [Thalassotalea sp.]|nr:M1 family metallopeptidase [Thalassotalea sp.]
MNITNMRTWSLMSVRHATQALLLGLLLLGNLFAQPAQAESNISAEEQSRLRGSVTLERAWWDLVHYELHVAVDIEAKRFTGKNTVSYRVLSESKDFQIELQAPMKIVSASQNGQTLATTSRGYSHFISLATEQVIGGEYQITIEFEGQPHIAKNAPWDGGVTWAEDSSGMPFVATANQGIGSSIWWPNKDHGYDEPDRGIDMFIEVPQPLVDVSNGRLVNIEENEQRGTRTYHWQVKSPINNYGVNINIADYVNFSEQYQGEAGTLDMDYYILRENEEKARVQFKDAVRAMEALEYWFGAYPFYQDGFKLVEVPYLGMEHQSSVTYGNGYKNGYKGKDWSDSDWGLKWDYIIIHEMAHEWFANNVTAKDVADIWIQESFTTYAEGLFVEYFYGQEAGYAYQRGVRKNVKNDKPMIGPYNVNQWGSSDVYFKGANVLHTLRQLVNDDEKWRSILRGLGKTFYQQTVTTKQIEDFIIEQSGLTLTPFFDQYLRDSRLPILQYRIKGNQLHAKWSNAVLTFDMAIKAKLVSKVSNKGSAEQEQWFKLTTEWQTFDLPEGNTKVVWDKNFYIATAFLAEQ